MNTCDEGLSVYGGAGLSAPFVFKHADHGVRLPRVAGREGSAAGGLRRLDVCRSLLTAKEPLAGPIRRQQPNGWANPEAPEVVSGFAGRRDDILRSSE